MLILLQEVVVQVFIWALRLIDGIMDLFSILTGVDDVAIRGRAVNIVEAPFGDPTLGAAFRCILILGAGLTCLFGIAAIAKNMLTGEREVGAILGRFLASLLGTFAVLLLVFLGMALSDALLKHVDDVFRLSDSPKLSSLIFDACAGEWVNGYTVAEFDVSTATARSVLGDSEAGATLLPVAWRRNGMVDPDSFLYVPSVIAGLSVARATFYAALNLARRAYDVVFLYLIMPVSASTLACDDGIRMKKWNETLVSKILLGYGAVFSVNAFMLVLPLLLALDPPGLSALAFGIFRVMVIVSGAMLIPAGQFAFARLFSSDDDSPRFSGVFTRAFSGAKAAYAMSVGKIVKSFGGRGAGKYRGDR